MAGRFGAWRCFDNRRFIPGRFDPRCFFADRFFHPRCGRRLRRRLVALLALRCLHIRFALLLQAVLFQLLRVDGLLRRRKIRPLLLLAAIRTVAAIAAAPAASAAVTAAPAQLVAFLRLAIRVLWCLVLLRPRLTLRALLIALLAVLLTLALRLVTLRQLLGGRLLGRLLQRLRLLGLLLRPLLAPLLLIAAWLVRPAATLAARLVAIRISIAAMLVAPAAPAVALVAALAATLTAFVALMIAPAVAARFVARPLIALRPGWPHGRLVRRRGLVGGFIRL